MRLSLAAGGFAIGIVCAVAAVNVASQFIRPMAMEPEPVAEAARQIPVYSTSSALVAPKAPAAEDESAVTSRPRAVAKVTLPTIGRAVPVASETDGRGDDSAVRMPPVRLTDNAGVPTATAKPDPKLIQADTQREEEKPEQTKVAAREPEASVEPTNPEPAVQPRHDTRPPFQVRSRPRPERQVERSRPSRSSNSSRYARPERSRSYARPSYAAGYRTGPVYGSNGAPVSGSFPY